MRGGARRIPDRHAISWVVLTPDGRVLATYSDPVDFCAALQRQIEKVETRVRSRHCGHAMPPRSRCSAGTFPT